MTWFAIQTLPQSEMKAVESLQRMLVNAQCPVFVERRIRHRRSATIRQQVEKPMFRGYVLVECGYLPEWIYRERYVLRPLVSPIPDHLVQNALEMSGTITINEWREVQKFAAGDSVLHKPSGLIAKVGDVKGEKLLLLVELANKMHRNWVKAEQVEAA